jgi:hypothetical protein
VLPEVLGRLVDQRHAVAVEDVARLRAEFPSADPDTLADLLIRRCIRDMALGGAVTGGAAASPVAGVAVAAASSGTDAAWSVSRLGELVMGLGVVYGHDRATRQEKAAWIAAVLGLSEGAAVGVTGLAARLGARGGARLVARLPAVGAGAAGAGRVARAGSTVGRLATGRGPWSLAALVPYGIGAGVGAAGNAALAGAVGRTAKQYFTRLPPPPSGSTTGWATADPVDDLDDVIDVEVVEEIILDSGWFDPGPPGEDRLRRDGS